MQFTRKEAELSAWALALAAGETMRNSAIEWGIADATLGRVFGDKRQLQHNKGCYSLGYHLGRYTLLNQVRHANTIGEGKAALWESFKTSPEGRTYAAQYRMLDNH